MEISDKRRRTLWTILQSVAFGATAFLLSIISQMISAEPNQSYVTQSGQVVHCDALLRTRGPDHAVCSALGTVSTDPKFFLFLCLAFTFSFGIHCIASRPGRGLITLPPLRRK